MLGCIYKLLEELEDDFIHSYKLNNNILRLSKEKKEQALNELAQTEKYKFYKEIRKNLKERIS